MVPDRLRPLLRRGRRGLVRLAATSDTARRVMARTGRELSEIARLSAPAVDGSVVPEGEESVYGASYFGEGRDPGGDRHGLSGYASYDRISSNADIAAYLLWRNFTVSGTLDVGCARGYLVEALRELGVEAQGCDVSRYAVAHAAPGALGHIRVGDLASGLPFADGEFELVSALEILEHLVPAAVPAALAELRRVTGGVLYATIPSFGLNASGPDGHFEGKVRPERLAHYESLGADYGGPVPPEDLAVDTEGQPIEGHRTIASFTWWSDRFAEAGFERQVAIERRLYADIAPSGLGPFWNLYVLAVPEVPDELLAPRFEGRTLVELGLVHPLLAPGQPTARD